ncbi:MAG: hypothetical protein LAO22_03355 [Acidobacteriia bacterium]|nr:hypothetical protein [Terriglobia bacterium]
MGMRVILCVVFSVALPFSTYAVCNAPQPRMVCAEYFKEEATVIAKLIRITHHAPKDTHDYYVYELRVQKKIKGQIPSVFEIWEENSSGRAGFEWRKDESYLLFLSYSKDEHAWLLDGCGNSAPLKEAGRTLAAIERMQKASHGGVIQVVVADGIPGTTVVATSREKSYRGRVNSERECRIRVPEGHYKVSISEPGWSFSTDFFSYEKPEDVEIRNGSCAQIQLEASNKRK